MPTNELYLSISASLHLTENGGKVAAYDTAAVEETTTKPSIVAMKRQFRLISSQPTGLLVAAR